MRGKLEGKVAVVTGGSAGIGLAAARHFAMEGAQVFITGRRQNELNTALEIIGENATGVQGDVSRLDDLDSLYAVVKERTGRIDILFANAGIGEFVPLAEVTEAHFDKLFDINVKGMLFTVQKALPLLGDGASIILNGSVAGSTGGAAFSVYSATKAAVRSFARTWTTELKRRHIRVNVISPGVIKTPGYEGLAPNEEFAAHFEAGAVAATPMNRLGNPDEVARAVVFLASDDSSFITGIELFVDGGMAQI